MELLSKMNDLRVKGIDDAKMRRQLVRLVKKEANKIDNEKALIEKKLQDELLELNKNFLYGDFAKDISTIPLNNLLPSFTYIYKNLYQLTRTICQYCHELILPKKASKLNKMKSTSKLFPIRLIVDVGFIINV